VVRSEALVIAASEVCACLVTRGDQPAKVAEILASLLPFGQVVVWDNSVRDDLKTSGRYAAMLETVLDVVYFQDDDVIVPRRTQAALLEAYEPGVMVANWGHGENPDGYDDLPLVCGGAVVDWELPQSAIRRYLEHFPRDDGFLYDCDFAIGVLYPAFRHVYLPFEIDYAIAQAPERLCNQPWQRELKLRITTQARNVRDGVLLSAAT
jgi:hypothetical protein